MYKDAIETAEASGDRDLAEDLLEFFVSSNDKECFAATLFTCGQIIRPDVALEHAWRNGIMDFAMPYLIQYLRNASELLKTVDERTAPKSDDPSGEEQRNAEMAAQVMYNPGVLALGNAPYDG